MNLTSFNNLIQGLQRTDPRLYEALKQISAEVIRLQLEVFPPEGVGLIQEDAPTAPPELATFTYTILPDNILLEWTLLSGAAARYEIREGGTSYATANTVIQTDTSSARIDPLSTGTHRYWIKGISEDGVYSSTPLFIDIIVSPIGSTVVTAQVIDNNVLLYWTVPTSPFRLSHYIVRKDSVEIGISSSTFQAIFEVVSGSYTYSVQAVDIVGNLGPESSVLATVTQPPDYELRADVLDDLTGTKTNTWLLDGPKLLCNTRVETWAQHFTDRGWSTIQDQVNAGFPLYAQPSVEIGTYQRVIDFGLVISNTVLTLSYNTTLIIGAGFTITNTIETSLDGIAWGSPISGSSVFVATLRYARITYTFTALS